MEIWDFFGLLPRTRTIPPRRRTGWVLQVYHPKLPTNVSGVRGHTLSNFYFYQFFEILRNRQKLLKYILTLKFLKFPIFHFWSRQNKKFKKKIRRSENSPFLLVLMVMVLANFLIWLFEMVTSSNGPEQTKKKIFFLEICYHFSHCDWLNV